MRYAVPLLLASFPCVAALGQAEPTFDLKTEIPNTRHVACGLTRLTPSQTKALSAEVWALMAQSYRLGQSSAKQAPNGVALIAPSVSTAQKAREVMQRMKWIEVKPRRADNVLVVVRSALFNPLRDRYESFGELRRDAENQLKIAGPKFHVYTYTLDDDLRVSQTEHVSQDAGF